MNNGYQQSPGGQPGGWQPGGFYQPPPPPDSHGKTAQTFGIIALVGLFMCQILSIIFGALALSNAKKSLAMLGFETAEAKTGRVCGLISLIIGSIATALVLIYSFFLLFIFIFVLGAL